jgi:enterochelin esterase family protein
LVAQTAGLVVVALACLQLGWRAHDRVMARRAADAATRAESADSPALAALADDVRRGRSGAIERFWHDAQGHAPLIEPVPGDAHRRRVTFLWRGDGGTRAVALAGGPPSDSKARLAHLDGTDVWFRTESVPDDARFTYWFHVNLRDPPKDPAAYAKWAEEFPPVPDPLNPNRIGERSVVELPAAMPQPWIVARPGTPRREMTPHTLHSAALNEDRSFAVYLPPGYVPKGPPCGLLVAFDGDGLPEDPTTLDNLIADGRIPPLVAVFVRQRDRSRELGCSGPFVTFLADELVPWVRAHYAVSPEPRRVIVRGLSLGGLMASYCALRRPDVFGNVLSQSGSYQWFPEGANPATAAAPPVEAEPGWLTRQYVDSPPRDVTFYLEAGRFEDFTHNSLLTENRRFRDVLRAKGYTVHYAEFTGGHDPLNWRGSFADGLIALVGTAAATAATTTSPMK